MLCFVLSVILLEKEMESFFLFVFLLLSSFISKQISQAKRFNAAATLWVLSIYVYLVVF